jgi:hypothetical protein
MAARQASGSPILQSRRLASGAATAGVALGLGALVWALYRAALGLWWADDDFFSIHYLATYRPAQIAFDPAVWQRMPFRMVTPLLFASLDLDLRAFGLRPEGAYLHQLISLALCALCLYAALRVWLPRLWAAAGAGFFLLGPPVAALAVILSTRHFAEATALAALSVAAYGLALRRGRIGWAIPSAALYLLAMLGKEIAVPLALLLPLIPARPQAGLRRRLILVSPHGVALLIYLAYRRAVQGVWLGGYGWAVAPGDWPRVALELPGRLARELAGGTAAGWALVALLGLGLAVLALRRPAAAPLLAAALLFAALPVLPVSLAMAPRYAVPLWTVASLALVFAVFDLGGGAVPETPETPKRPESWRRGAALLVAVAAACLGLAANRGAWSAALGAMERKSAENLAFLGLRPGDLLRRPLEVPAALWELTAFRRDRLGRGEGGSWFDDDLYLCTGLPPGARVWSYDAAARRVVDVTARVPALAASYCGGIRGRAPLTAELRSDGESVSWRLGPYRDGRYALVMREGIEALEVPRVAAYQRRHVTRLDLRVRYESPAGWVTYSPPLKLDFSRSPVARWSRPPGDAPARGTKTPPL